MSKQYRVKHPAFDDLKRRALYGLGLEKQYNRVSALRRSHDFLFKPWTAEMNAIFVHIPKTAGTSVFRTLAAEPSMDTHALALTYRDKDRAFFDQAYCFSFVRNPWDRFSSAFHFLKNNTTWQLQIDWANRHLAHHSFESFTHELAQNAKYRGVVMGERFFWPQYYWLMDTWGKETIVDDIFPFEDFSQSMITLCARLGRPVPQMIPHSRQSQKKPYTAYYTPEMVDLVAKLYAKDIKVLGYRFDGAHPRLALKDQS